MKIKKTLILFLLIFSLKSWAITIHSVQHGIWSEPSTWSTNTVPFDGDSVYVHHEVLVGGLVLRLHDFYLNITETGCLCGINADIFFHNSILINDGHMAFLSLELHDNSVGTSSGTLLLARHVIATNNSSMTITNGFIHITPENDLTCTCFDSTRYDSLVTSLDSTAIVNFSFEDYFNLISDTMSICTGDTIILNFTDSVTFEWSDGSFSNSIIPETNDWYSVKMTQKGDTITDSVYVKLLERFDLIFPNIYTPNKDGVNDIIEISNLHSINLVLYNRWGKCIYQYEGDGLKLEEINISDGVYYYLINVKGECVGKLSEQKGWLQILR